MQTRPKSSQISKVFHHKSAKNLHISEKSSQIAVSQQAS